jgi:Icc-related predicted phosphoesterase
MIGVAAVADLHFGDDSEGMLRPHLHELAERADVFVIAGDLTKRGTPEEARVAAREFGGLGLPTFAVLGNHDHHSDAQDEVARILERAGVCVLEGEADVIDVRGARVAIAGTKGFGGGFAGACATDFGERETKDFIGHTRYLSDRLCEALSNATADVKIAVTHYAPIRGTLHGEKLEIYPFLGSYLLAEAADHAHVDLVVHGHAHAGTEKGVTPGGIHVRNVAYPVIKKPYALYTISPDAEREGNGAEGNGAEGRGARSRAQAGI